MPAYLRCKLNVFKRGKVRHQIVKLKNKTDAVSAQLRQPAGIVSRYFLAVEGDPAVGQAVHAAEDVEQRRFARAGGSDDNAHFSFFYIKCCVPQRLYLHLARAVCFAHIAKFYKCHMSSAFHFLTQFYHFKSMRSIHEAKIPALTQCVLNWGINYVMIN